MPKIVIGKSDHGLISFVLETLLRTRLLIQANSGGGKSWLIRLLAELLFGKVQVIIIDREGEFASLRPKFGYLHVGQVSEGADLQVDVRSARLLAEKLLELGTSAICDLYEAFRTNPSGRRAWVAAFLEGLIDAPKALWHDCIVIVDEAHQFCPEASPKAASPAEREIISRCKEAMVALATVGRKRGYCAIWATQRLAKLDKDASAELFNRLVGMTVEDVDVDRAVDLMSVSREDRHDFKKTLRDLEPGNFFAFGRAVAKERTLFKVHRVTTQHPEAGSKGFNAKPPPVPEAIRLLLPKLADLTKEADQKAKTEADLKKEVAALKAQLASAQRIGAAAVRAVKVPAPVPAKPEIRTETKIVEVAAVSDEEVKRVNAILARMEKLAIRMNPVMDLQKDLRGQIGNLSVQLGKAVLASEKLRKMPPAKAIPAPPPRPVAHKVQRPAAAAPAAALQVLAAGQDPDWKPGRSHLAILKAILEFGSIGIEAPTRWQVAGWLGLKYTGSFRTNLSDLRTAGYIDYRGARGLVVTEAGNVIAPPAEVEPTVEGILEHAMSAFSGSEAAILKTVHGIHPEWMTRQDLAEAIGVTVSGSFRTNLSALHVAEVIEYGEGDRKNQVKCADWMFLGEPVAS